MSALKSLRPRSLLREFLRRESAAGVILMATAALAMVVAQTPLAGAYFAVQHLELAGLDLLHWINDGLMSLFFLLVGLEIKRELLDGQLATKSRRILPGAAALGGMLVPALIYVALNSGDAETLRGWAIPTATDIAFALGVLALLGSRVPVSLKVFLTALAILDDLGAVVVIALFYTGELSPIWLLLAASTLGVLALLNQLRVAWLPAYLAFGLLLWLCVLRSGVHATLAGVALALTIPIRVHLGGPDDPQSPLHRLEHALHGWVAYLVLPIFGFANAGVSLAGMQPSMLLSPLPLGIALGLLVGKQVGVFLFAWGAIRLGVAELPAHASWAQLYGVALLCGIGFTMSLFIGGLAFAVAPALLDATKIGVLSGSLLSALLGWGVLRVVRGEAPDLPPPPPAPSTVE